MYFFLWPQYTTNSLRQTWWNDYRAVAVLPSSCWASLVSSSCRPADVDSIEARPQKNLWGQVSLEYHYLCLHGLYPYQILVRPWGQIIILRFVKKSLCNFSIVNSFIFKNCIKYRQSSGKFSIKFHHFQHFQPKFLIYIYNHMDFSFHYM